MDITLVPTADGSNTLYNAKIGENYHSKHGAVQESLHVFINAGLAAAANRGATISVFEVGFGTGLNYLLSLDFAAKHNLTLHYTAVELYPLDLATIASTAYDRYVSAPTWQMFSEVYEQALSAESRLPIGGSLQILPESLQALEITAGFDLLYFDAFSVRHQPEMWTDEIITKSVALLKPGGIFVTYAITGNLKRALKASGCTVEKLAGPPGKREMLRAFRNQVK